jgi:hypothetical protein
MESTSSTTNAGTGLAPSDDLLYEVVDGQVVELAPMGAYEIRIASVLLMYLETFARQHQLGRAVQEMLFEKRINVTCDAIWGGLLVSPKSHGTPKITVPRE